jgi:hypothetical protein
MIDDGVGRLLVASLHQGIADAMPDRLEFYEHWLRPAGGGTARVGLAGLGAVLSFLRREGQPAYDDVMGRAGRHSAEWTIATLSGVRRGLITRLPSGVRTRLVLGLSRRLVRETFRPSRATVAVRRGTGSMTVHDSVFCTLRTPASAPMCAFYAAAVQRMLELFELSARTDVGACRAEGATHCQLLVTALGARPGASTAEAA